MVATPEIVELQCELMVTSCVLPSLNVPIAANCCVAPAVTNELAGCMSIDTRVPEPMVTVVVPLIPDAEAVRVSVPAFFACKMPLPRILARLFLEDLHDTLVRVAVLPSLYVPVAVNLSEVPLDT